MEGNCQPKEMRGTKRKRDHGYESPREDEIWDSLLNNYYEVEESDLESCTPFCTFERNIEGFPVQSSPTGTVMCEEKDCDFRTHRIIQLRHHLVYEHNLKLRSWTNYFSDTYQFERWKVDYLSKNPHISLYPVNTKSSESRKHFYCSLGKRTMIVDGKKRITNACTSTLRVTFNKLNKSIFAELIVDHYGHTHGDNPIVLPKSNFTENENEYIDTFVRSGASKEEFIRMYANTLQSEEKRQEMVHEFERMKFQSQSKSYENLLSKDSTIEMWNQLIAGFGETSFYAHKSAKDFVVVIRMPPEVDVEPLHIIDGFGKDDFFVVFMSEAQKKLLLRNMKMYVLQITVPEHKNFKLYQLFVLNNSKNIAPVAFCCTTARQSISLNYFFKFLKCACGDIRPSLLVCNSFSGAFEQWTKVFEDVENDNEDVDDNFVQFISPWFVDKEFWKRMVSCNLNESESDDIFQSFIRLRDCKSLFVYNEIKVDIINKLNNNRMQPMFDFFSQYLLTNRYRWSMHQARDFGEEFQIMRAYFTEINMKRFSKFACRKLGKCILNVLQFHLAKDNIKKQKTRRPGKQRDPIVGAPSLNRASNIRAPSSDNEETGVKVKEEPEEKKGSYKVTKEQLAKLGFLVEQYGKVLHNLSYAKRLEMRKVLTDLALEMAPPDKTDDTDETLQKIKRMKRAESYNRFSQIKSLPRPKDLGPKIEPKMEASAVVPVRFKIVYKSQKLDNPVIKQEKED